MNDDPIMVFAGSGSPRLTARICKYLDIPQGKNETLRFSDGNTFVRILENVRGRRVYIVQTTVFPSNDNFMELLFWIDAFKRAGADSVTVCAAGDACAASVFCGSPVFWEGSSFTTGVSSRWRAFPWRDRVRGEAGRKSGETGRTAGTGVGVSRSGVALSPAVEG